MYEYTIFPSFPKDIKCTKKISPMNKRELSTSTNMYFNCNINYMLTLDVLRKFEEGRLKEILKKNRGV